jgi:hypothetical protein
MEGMSRMVMPLWNVTMEWNGMEWNGMALVLWERMFMGKRGLGPPSSLDLLTVLAIELSTHPQNRS